MSFGKSFGFSLLAFIGLNAAFFFGGYALNGTLISYFNSLAASPLNIMLIFFGPIITGQFPYLLTSTFVGWLSGMPITAGDIVLFIGYIVAPILAAFLSGRFGEDKKQAFFGWFTTVMICAVVVLIGGVIQLVILAAPFSIILSQAIAAIALGLIYGLACGSISLLTAKEF
ncbi:MAG: hypothetical protein ACFFCY_02730 [Promethearchaeota archaeon]